MKEKKMFKKGEQNIEIKADCFKVFLRPRTTMTANHIAKLIETLRSPDKIIIIPRNIDVIVVRKDGTTTKY